MKVGRAQTVRLDHVQDRLQRVEVPSRGWLLSWRRWAIIFAILEQDHVQ